MEAELQHVERDYNAFLFDIRSRSQLHDFMCAMIPPGQGTGGGGAFADATSFSGKLKAPNPLAIAMTLSLKTHLLEWSAFLIS